MHGCCLTHALSPSADPRTLPDALTHPNPQAGVADATDAKEMLAHEIQPHGELIQGRLPNGLQYVLLPNKTPPARFEAHLEMHVGSVDERADEQVGASAVWGWGWGLGLGSAVRVECGKK